MTEESKERAIRFATKDAFEEAVRYLWRKKPFELGGWECLIVSTEVADELLEKFQGEAREIQFVDLVNLPKEEVLRVHRARFGRFRSEP